MKQGLSLQEILKYFEDQKYNIKRATVGRYVKIGAAGNAINNNYGLLYDDNKTKKYYHPVDIIEMLTAYYLFKGKLVSNNRSGEFDVVNITPAVDYDVFTGKVMFFADKKIQERLEKLFNFNDYPINRIQVNLPKTFQDAMNKDGNEAIIATVNELARPRMVGDTIIPWDDYLSVKLMNPYDIKIDFDNEGCFPYKNHENYKIQSIAQMPELLARINDENEKYLAEAMGDKELANAYVKYQKLVYGRIFMALMDRYLPSIITSFYKK